jgi:uncharacterized protein (TIGR03437 family)
MFAQIFTCSSSRITKASCCLFLLVACALPTMAGSGRFKNGVYDFCVSVRFNANDADLQKIRDAFSRASQVLADATDGQQRFGTITIVNNSGASETAEYWVNSGAGRAYATIGQYGVRGTHVNLYFASNFQGTDGADGDSFTIAHEHAHHSFGVVDEYSGPMVADGADCAVRPEPNTLNYCLMDNYFVRGGRQGGGSAYTLKEFCVAGNHDPDGNNFQSTWNMQSCWQTIAAHPKRSATAPVGLPVTTVPAVPAVMFKNGTADLRVMLVIDRSGSMDIESRLGFAKSGANQFINFLRTNDSVGVVSFSSSSSLNFPLTKITGVGTKTAAKGTINALVADGTTNIGGGLQTAIDQFTAQTDRSCAEIIVLLTDGDHNTGTPPASVIPKLQEEGITVITVGLGAGISTSGEVTLQNIASQTGGKFFRVSNAFGLSGLFLNLVFESYGSGLLTRSPLALAPGQTSETNVLVEPGTSSATFATTFSQASANLTFSLRSPSGLVISEAMLPNFVTLLKENNSIAFQVNAPEAGTWKMLVTAGTGFQGQAEVIALAEHVGTQLIAAVKKETLTAPEAIEIQATPLFEGANVTGAIVSGVVTRPDGTKVTIPFFDDGNIANADAVANDGIYGAKFSSYRGNGVYSFDIIALINNGQTYAGEALFLAQPTNSKLVPNFQRIGSTTAIVTGVPTTDANLSISKTAQPTTVAPGANVVYTLTITNQGPDAASSVTVEDNLLSNLSFVSCTATAGGTCAGTGNNRTVTFPTLASGATATVMLTAKVSTSVPGGTTISNTATVNAATPDPSTNNNSATFDVTVAGSQFEGDVSPRPDGDGKLTMVDWVQLGNFFIRQDVPAAGAEFQRADCAPKATKGDGIISIADWVQAGRYAAGLDPVVAVGGPTGLPVLSLTTSGATAEGSSQLRVVPTQFQRGQISTLHLELDAMGNENALAFTLNFDPKVMTFLDATLGDGAQGATLNLNQSQAAQGRIGIAMALSIGQAFAAGNRAMLKVRFVPMSGTATTSTVVGFDDQILRREIVDAEANTLSATSFSNATIELVGRAAAHVIAANYAGPNVAADSIASAFGVDLATTTAGAAAGELPTTLGGTRVVVKDSQGVERRARLFFVSPNQVNYEIPAGTAEGYASVTITDSRGINTAGFINVTKVAPGAFSADASGKGWAAADVVYVKPDQSQVIRQVARFDAGQNQFVPMPIDLSTDTAVLVLYGTGVRHRAGLANVKIKIGGIDVEVDYADRQGQFAGLDQINVRLPRGLAGRGEVNVEVNVEGKVANAVRIFFK